MQHLTSLPQNAASDLEGTIKALRHDFPILKQTVHGKPLVFLDSAASAQKPLQVIQTFERVFSSQYANIHRGLHWMSERTTEAYEGVRDKVAQFIGARNRKEIIFTRNSTEAINLVAYSFGSLLKHGQAIVISEMEHHANIIPWQLLAERRHVELKIAPITEDGDLDMVALKKILSTNDVGLVSITHMSNVLGSIVNAKQVADLAHAVGAKVLFDGSQSIVHMPVDVNAIEADFYTFTAHKLYGPTGVGVLWARAEILNAMPPFMGGGDMISSVSFSHSTWADIPHKFEAGTPAIAEVIALGAAIDYVQSVGYEIIQKLEADVSSYALSELGKISGLTILGNPKKRGGVISFIMEGAHPHDIATLLDHHGVAIRAGHHCAEPLMKRLGVTSTARASFGIYSTRDDVDIFVSSLEQIRMILQ